MIKKKLKVMRQVSMSDVVSHKQSRAAKRAVRKAVIESIKDQAQMAKLAHDGLLAKS